MQLAAGRASVAGVRQALGLAADEIDADYGVVEIDPDQNLYAVLVDPRTAERVAGREGVEGPFSNPRVEPFGPPQP